MSPKFTFMLRIFFLIALFPTTFTYCQVQQWTWMKGDNTVNNRSVYGTLGVPAVGNKPGSRTGGVTGTDLSGNLWLFGGHEGLSDVWKYSPSTNLWIWVKGDSAYSYYDRRYGTRGIPSATNTPGRRYGSINWTDALGNFWLFGGSGSDLWHFNTTTYNWTWISGDTVQIGYQPGVYGHQGVASPTNQPGPRSAGSSWTDASGDLWFFGGYGNSGTYNDLWKFNPVTAEWTWMKGSNTSGNSSVYAGVYGVQGVPSPANTPGARIGSATWTDVSGNLWLFGGDGTQPDKYAYNDLWKYNISTNQWTWIRGDNTGRGLGVYGTQGVASPANTPGGRRNSVTWTDAMGNFWLFGGKAEGQHHSPGYGYGYLSDLWKYNPITNQWTWVSGSSVEDVIQGVYGTQGIASAANRPGAREEAMGWKTPSGDFWIFGGRWYYEPVFNEVSYSGYYNDLWKFSAGNALPITLRSFNGKLQSDKAILNWTAENEINFNHYDIERSFTASEFAKVGEVKAINSHVYNYNDNAGDLNGRKVYYRLKLVDKDGTYTYSSTILLQGPDKMTISIYPNPAIISFHLALTNSSGGKAIMQLIDLTGKIVMKRIFGVNADHIISTSKLPVGTYTIKIIYQDQQYLKKIIVRQ